MYGSASDSIPGNIFGIERIGAIWFLEALFWGELELHFLKKIKSELKQVVYMLVIALIGYCICKIFWLPGNLGPGAFACIFLYIGNTIRKYGILECEFSFTQKIEFVGIWLFCIIMDYYFKMPVSIAINQYPLMGLGIFGGVGGTYAIMEIAKWLEKHMAGLAVLLEKLGGMTIYVLCVHLVDLDCFPWRWIGNQTGYEIIKNPVLFLMLRLVLDIGVAVLLKIGICKMQVIRNKKCYS